MKRPNKKYLIVLAYLAFYSFRSNGQLNVAFTHYQILLPDTSSLYYKQNKKSNYYLSPKKNYFNPNFNGNIVSTKFIFDQDLLKHVAFFCKLEDQVFDKLNFWIKLRAGDDDAYRKFTEIK